MLMSCCKLLSTNVMRGIAARPPVGSSSDGSACPSPCGSEGVFPKEERCWDGEDVGGGCGLIPPSSAPLADGERLGEVTDPGRRPAAAQASAWRRKAEDSSESHEEEPMVIRDPEHGQVGRDLQRLLVRVPYPTHGQLEQGAPSLVQRSRSKDGEGTTSLVLLSNPHGG